MAVVLAVAMAVVVVVAAVAAVAVVTAAAAVQGREWMGAASVFRFACQG